MKRVYHPSKGESLKQVIKKMILLADQLNVEIMAAREGKVINVLPGSTVQDVLDKYNAQEPLVRY